MKKNEYDAIIIGAGIGGLVCGCYLAKAGMKVLIVEKNQKVGGYCSSFKRRGFIFDAAIHALQNCSPGNLLNKIFNELGVANKIKFVRHNPTDTVVTENHKIHINKDIEQTILNFKKSFPNETKGIDSFFKLFRENNISYIYAKYRTTSFQDLLEHYFGDKYLKLIFDMFLGNIGSRASNTSCISAYALIKQFILFGGYYPLSGMQTIPDALVDKLTEYGGKMLLKQKVDKILINKGNITGVKVGNGREIKSKIVVSNSDLSFTLETLLDREVQSKQLLNRIKNTKTSLSIYIVYLSLKKSLENYDSGPGLWYVIKENLINKDLIIQSPGIFCSISSKLDKSLSPEGCDQLRIMTNTKFYNQSFWLKNGKEFSSQLITMAKNVVPLNHEDIICSGRATSVTMSNYTHNRNGSVSGWLNSPEQLNDSVVNYLPKIQGLFFTGHWITDLYGNGGVAMVADSGKKTAKRILKTCLQ